MECQYSAFAVQYLSQLHIRTAATSNWRVFSICFSKSTMSLIIHCKIFSFGIRVNPVYPFSNKMQYEGTFHQQKIVTFIKKKRRSNSGMMFLKKFSCKSWVKRYSAVLKLKLFIIFFSKNGNVLCWHTVDESENWTTCNKIIFGGGGERREHQGLYCIFSTFGGGERKWISENKSSYIFEHTVSDNILD